ncbi:MAG: hypothetical protein QOH06_2807 [Acidobacteriota bacterium]|jgi:hypothetical protein|nr:hypothetical protein [Acidobacteriota bacterium]
MSGGDTEMTLKIELPTDLERELSVNGAELVDYWRTESLIGVRPEIVDSQEHARKLRTRAERRH